MKNTLTDEIDFDPHAPLRSAATAVTFGFSRTSDRPPWMSDEQAEIARLQALLGMANTTIKSQNDAVAEQAAEIAALKADYERACKLVADMHMAAMGGIVGPKLGVVEDVAALRKDAERYRWLRDKNTGDATVYEVTHDDGNLLRHSEELDTAIDAALAQAVQPS